MKKAALLFLTLILAALVLAQSDSSDHNPFSTWNVYFPDVLMENRSPYTVGAMTPIKPIIVRRIEALSNKGPTMGALRTGEPIPCPVQYTLEITNGISTHTVPISNTFVGKMTSQTYTDSGTINVEFSAGNRIAVSLIAPKPQFPPVNCMIAGLNIAIQYELAEPPAKDKAE